MKVTGIIRPNADASSNMLSGSIAYTNLLTKEISKRATNSDALNEQLKNPTIDIFTGNPFTENKENLSIEQKAAQFDDYLAKISAKSNNFDSKSEEEQAKELAIINNKKGSVYVSIKSIPNAEELEATKNQIKPMMQIPDDFEGRKEYLLNMMLKQYESISEEVKAMIENRINKMTEKEINDSVELMLTESAKQFYASNVQRQLSTVSDDQKASLLDTLVKTLTLNQKAEYHDAVLEFSTSTYKDNLIKLGYIDLDDPHTINIFASTFENKEIIEDAIKKYNEGTLSPEELISEYKRITGYSFVPENVQSLTDNDRYNNHFDNGTLDKISDYQVL